MCSNFTEFEAFLIHQKLKNAKQCVIKGCNIAKK